MQKVNQPQVYLVAQTALTDGLLRYLQDIGNPEWKADDVPDGQVLAEAMGRLCYRSWQPYDPSRPECSNPNVSKVRVGNEEYLKNIIRSGHGSVLEHINMSFIIRDCSRVFTHEVVRHRVGTAFSQESLRYVRMNDIRFWFPESLTEEVDGVSAQQQDDAIRLFVRMLEQMVDAQEKLSDLFQMDSLTRFETKKKLTSLFRRIAPIGLATTLGMTANVRTLRHVIELRTSPHAEEELRFIFGRIANLCKEAYPALFFDMEQQSNGTCSFEFSKV